MKKIIAILIALLLFIGTAFSETVYVLCQPDSFVNVRAFPKKNAQVTGWAELGDELETDGARKNGYVHVYGFEGGAWICAGFVTEDPVTVATVPTVIQSKGRVACRRSIKGTRRKWLSDGQKVVIYAFSDGWSITDKGFIQTRFLGGF